MSETSNVRLFLALWLPDALRDAVAAQLARWQWPSDARLQPPERWHVTLHFIGSVPVARLPEIGAGLEVPFEPFELTLQQPRLWPGGIAVVVPRAVPAPLVTLHERLGDALRTLALPCETRPYRPHLTLARRASGAVVPDGDSPLPPWRADGYRLVRSLPGGGGYQPVRLYAGSVRARTPG
jgi:2'-5' RNA ligase